MLKKKLLEHRVILLVILFIIIVGYIWNLFIGKHLIILTGEYIFSFDYFGHFYNILFDPRSTLAFDNTNCFDCIDFYHYSRWYSLFKIGYHSFSQILFLHPFVFYILSILITQLLSLYIFAQLLFKKFTWLPFIISSFVFIFYPYKYSLLVATEDGVIYASMILYFAIFIWIMRNLKKIKQKKLFWAGSVTGLLFSSFFNINIAFLPIVIYSTLAFTIVYIKDIFTEKRKILIFSLCIFIPTIIINIPLFSSLLTYGDTLHYYGYISFNHTDSFLAGLYTAQANEFTIKAFGLLFLFCFIFAPITFKKKMYMAGFYLFIALLIMGKNSPIDIFGWMFINLPLFDGLRATYRLMFFESVIFFVIVYFTLQRFQSRNYIKGFFLFVISAFFIFLPIYHIYLHTNYFFTTTLPDEYFQAQTYLNTLPQKKIYFPTNTLITHTIATDYTWGDPNYSASILLYKNPYTSLLPIHNLVQFERFPYLLSPQFQELKYLTDIKLSPDKIIKALELRGVQYIVIDDNYKWSANYPSFDEHKFIKLAKIQKKFGNIYILKLPDKSKECKKGYGMVALDYCTSYDNPKILKGTEEDFLLEQFPQKIDAKEFSLRKNALYLRNVLDPLLHQSFIDNRVLLSREIMQVFGNQQNVFNSQYLTKGKYEVYISIYKYDKIGNIMGNIKVAINTPSGVVKTISPYTDKPGMYWIRVPVTISSPGRINIDMIGDGYVVFGFTPRIKSL